jgi:GH25 family lysozyme M1 (1,4-beta-N-acetylmuramidase)
MLNGRDLLTRLQSMVNRPARRRLRGVDVSSFQGRPGQWKSEAGRIAWAAVKITELEPNGTRYVNPDAAADWAFLHRNQKVRVAYLFGHPSVNSAHTVSFFLEEMHKLGLHDDDAVALDIEVTDGRSPSEVAAWCGRVTSELRHRTGRHPVVYTFLSFAEAGNCRGLGHLPLWIADPSSRPGRPRVPRPWKTWTMHQYNITGSIDRDLAKFTSRAKMAAALGKEKVPHMKNLGGSNTSALASVRWDNGDTVVAGIGKDGFIRAIRWANGKWGPWRGITTEKALHPPAMIAWGQGHGHLYYTNEKGDVIEIGTGDFGQTWTS